MASKVELVKSINEIVDTASNQHTLTQIFKLGFIDSIKLRLWGNVKVGYFSRGSNRLPAYLFECDVHGLQVTSPSGHYELLLCPVCLRERQAEEEHREEHESNSYKSGSENSLRKYLTKNVGKNK